MKRTVAALIIFMLILGVSMLNTRQTIQFADELAQYAEAAVRGYRKGNWTDVRKNVECIDELWRDKEIWLHLTLSTKQMDEIEIAIGQCMAYGEAEAEDPFAGEITMLSMLIEHLPKQDGFSVGELL